MRPHSPLLRLRLPHLRRLLLQRFITTDSYQSVTGRPELTLHVTTPTTATPTTPTILHLPSTTHTLPRPTSETSIIITPINSSTTFPTLLHDLAQTLGHIRLLYPSSRTGVLAASYPASPALSLALTEGTGTIAALALLSPVVDPILEAPVRYSIKDQEWIGDSQERQRVLGADPRMYWADVFASPLMLLASPSVEFPKISVDVEKEYDGNDVLPEPDSQRLRKWPPQGFTPGEGWGAKASKEVHLKGNGAQASLKGPEPMEDRLKRYGKEMARKEREEAEAEVDMPRPRVALTLGDADSDAAAARATFVGLVGKPEMGRAGIVRAGTEVEEMVKWLETALEVDDAAADATVHPLFEQGTPSEILARRGGAMLEELDFDPELEDPPLFLPKKKRSKKSTGPPKEPKSKTKKPASTKKPATRTKKAASTKKPATRTKKAASKLKAPTLEDDSIGLGLEDSNQDLEGYFAFEESIFDKNPPPSGFLDTVVSEAPLGIISEPVKKTVLKKKTPAIKDSIKEPVARKFWVKYSEKLGSTKPVRFIRYTKKMEATKEDSAIEKKEPTKPLEGIKYPQKEESAKPAWTSKYPKKEDSTKPTWTSTYPKKDPVTKNIKSPVKETATKPAWTSNYPKKDPVKTDIKPPIKVAATKSARATSYSKKPTLTTKPSSPAPTEGATPQPPSVVAEVRKRSPWGTMDAHVRAAERAATPGAAPRRRW